MNGRDGGQGGGDDASFEDLMGDATERIDRGPDRVTPMSGRRSQAREASKRRTPGARFRWPDPEDGFRAAAMGVNDSTLFALARGEPEPEERIDLHGARRDTAGRVLAQRIESARTRGIRSVVVIHGRGQHSPGGEAILRDALPGWLTRGAAAKSVLAFAPAPDRLGGRGATMVLLRR